MFGRLHRFLGFGLLVVSTVTLAWGAVFVLPAEGPVPFRRDRVPLDEDTMIGLAERLVVLADEVDGENAAERRRAAQMLALSLALDPVNNRARKLLRQFGTVKHRASRDAKSGEAREWISGIQGWLASGDAGDDGNALAACVKDALNLRSDAPESGEWKGWIAELSEFEDASRPDPVVEVDLEDNEIPGIQLESANVSVPLWKMVENSQPPQWKLVLSKLVMSGVWQPAEEPKKQRFSLEIGDPEVSRKPTAEVGSLLQLLRELHGDLPNGAAVKISSPELEAVWPKQKRQSFSAAAAVLASAALTGTEPTGTIIGLVDATGKLTLPDDSWEQLRSLAPDEAPRVILPTSSAEDLSSLLVMGDPEFFMNHEILLAFDFKQLLELSAKDPIGSVRQVISSFGTIRAQGEGRQVGPYVARSSVRKALADLALAAPYHASARMLAVQGAGNRPSYITRRVLIGELKIALEPLQWLVDHGHNAFTDDEQKKIGETFETCRSAVEQLLRYSEKADHGVVNQALEMVASIRTLDRAGRSKTDDDDEGSMSTAEAISYSAFLVSRKEFMAKLDPSSAEAEK